MPAKSTLPSPCKSLPRKKQNSKVLIQKRTSNNSVKEKILPKNGKSIALTMMNPIINKLK